MKKKIEWICVHEWNTTGLFPIYRRCKKCDIWELAIKPDQDTWEQDQDSIPIISEIIWRRKKKQK
jgi:hypothetical protein